MCGVYHVICKFVHLYRVPDDCCGPSKLRRQAHDVMLQHRATVCQDFANRATVALLDRQDFARGATLFALWFPSHQQSPDIQNIAVTQSPLSPPSGQHPKVRDHPPLSSLFFCGDDATTYPDPIIVCFNQLHVAKIVSRVWSAVVGLM